ncbi:MAG TPA: hypothetical protein VF266_08035 [Thermoanaerobaculia bacterium]
MAVSSQSLFTPRDAQNHRNFTIWMMGAVLSFITATLLIDGGWVPRAAGWALTAVSAILMVMAMRSYIGFIRHADELLRKIHLEALAFAFGAGIVAMMTYRLCERLGAPKLDVNDAALVMLLCWIGGQWLGARRYAGEEE